jgi:hypothetical protein
MEVVRFGISSNKHVPILTMAQVWMLYNLVSYVLEDMDDGQITKPHSIIIVVTNRHFASKFKCWMGKFITHI